MPEKEKAEDDYDESGEERTEEIGRRLDQAPMREWIRFLSAFHRNALQNDGRAFGQQEHLVINRVRPRRGQQTGWRFIERFVAETETAVMHRD